MGSPKSIGAWPSEATNTTRAGFERRRRGRRRGVSRKPGRGVRRRSVSRKPARWLTVSRSSCPSLLSCRVVPSGAPPPMPALLISTCSSGVRSSTSAASLRTSSRDERSASNVGAPPSSALSSSSFSRLRPWSRTCAPRPARSRATPRTRPSGAPGIRTVVSSIGRMPVRLAVPPICEHTFVRWKSQEIEEESQGRLPGYEEAVVRHFDAPEALDTRFYEVHAKSALNHVPKASRMPFPWTINPYRGCAHACTFCFARPTHEYLDLNAGRDFEKEIVVKVNVPEVLRVELARPSWKREHVALGTNTDPYQWVEGRYKLMRGIWEAMRDFANPCSIL